MNKELDIFIAENVMDWKLSPYSEVCTLNWWWSNNEGNLTRLIETYQWTPTTNLTQALEALGKYNESVKYDEDKILYFETVGTGWNISSNTTELSNGILKDAPLEVCEMIKKRSKDE